MHSFLNISSFFCCCFSYLFCCLSPQIFNFLLRISLESCCNRILKTFQLLKFFPTKTCNFLSSVFSSAILQRNGLPFLRKSTFISLQFCKEAHYTCLYDPLFRLVRLLFLFFLFVTILKCSLLLQWLFIVQTWQPTRNVQLLVNRRHESVWIKENKLNVETFKKKMFASKDLKVMSCHQTLSKFTECQFRRKCANLR